MDEYIKVSGGNSTGFFWTSHIVFDKNAIDPHLLYIKEKGYGKVMVYF